MKSKGFKTKYIYIAMAVLALIFIAYQLYKGFYNPIDTISAVQSSVYDSVSGRGFIIRGESAVLSQSSGTVVSAVDDGERVSKNGVIANIFSSKEAADNYLKLTEINEKIDYYESFISQKSNSGGDLALIDSNISSYVNNYVSEVRSGWIENISSVKDTMTDSITNRKILTGESVEVQSVLDELYTQRKSVKNSVSAHTDIFADNSGYFVSYTDGFEDIVETGNVVNLSVSNVQSMLESAETPVSDAVGKIVRDFRWYLACIVESDKIFDLDVGDTVEVHIDSANEDLQMKIEAINESTSSDNETLIVLSSDKIDSDICKLRKVDAEIRFNQYTGIKVPSSAIRSTTQETDGKGKTSVVKCVYTLSAQKVKEKKLEVLYEGDGYVIASSNTTQDGYIRLYDNIITKGKDLYDGKIID